MMKNSWSTIAYIPSEVGDDPDFFQCIQKLEGIRAVSLLPEAVTFGEWQENNPGRDLGDIFREKDIDTEGCLLVIGTDLVYRQAEELDVAIIAYSGAKGKKQEFAGAPLLVEGFAEIDRTFLRRRYERHHGIPWVIAKTERCIIRELALSDMDALFELYSQPHITDYIEPLFEREQEIEYQKAYMKYMYHYHGFGMWLVFDREDGSLIGRAGLELRDYPDGAGVELGYIITPHRQRQGYATEVCRTILGYAGQELGITEVHCLIEPGNEASIAFIRSIGFQGMGKMHMEGQEFEHYIFQQNIDFLGKM